MLSTLLAISLLHWVVLVTPGANVLVVTSLAANGGRASACGAALGVTAVAGFWSVLALMGVHAVFASHPSLRLGLQCVGALYLLYVAARLWRSGPARAQGFADSLTPWAAFRLGFLTNIVNPKSALFFGGVFATALPPEPSAALLFAAVALVLVNALIWHLFLAFAFSHGVVRAAYARQQSLLNRVAATMVGVFGVRLLFATLGEIWPRPVS